MRATRGVHLLEVAPELSAGLNGEVLQEAQRILVLAGFDLPQGELDLDAVRAAEDVAGHGWGLLVVSGALLNNVTVGGRTCSRLFGAGELIQLDGPIDELLPSRWSWTVRQDAHVVVLDDRLLRAGQRWPDLARSVHERAAQIGRQGFMERAISQLPRVEDRLLAFFWMIADRRGRVTPDGVVIDLPLTHEELGSLIGARRPTVSIGLRKLTEAGLIIAENSGWVLDRSSLDRFGDPDAEPA